MRQDNYDAMMTVICWAISIVLGFLAIAGLLRIGGIMYRAFFLA